MFNIQLWVILVKLAMDIVDFAINHCHKHP